MAHHLPIDAPHPPDSLSSCARADRRLGHLQHLVRHYGCGLTTMVACYESWSELVWLALAFRCTCLFGRLGWFELCWADLSTVLRHPRPLMLWLVLHIPSRLQAVLRAQPGGVGHQAARAGAGGAHLRHCLGRRPTPWHEARFRAPAGGGTHLTTCSPEAALNLAASWWFEQPSDHPATLPACAAPNLVALHLCPCASSCSSIVACLLAELNAFKAES